MAATRALEARVAALELRVPDGPCAICRVVAQVNDSPPPTTCSCPPVQYEDLLDAILEVKAADQADIVK